MDNQQEQELIDKYLAGECSPQEKEAIESWYLSYAKDKVDNLDEPDEADHIVAEQEIWNSITRQNRPRKLFLWSHIAAAASILFFLTIGAFFILHKQPARQIAKNQKTDIAPGGNKAVLTLANGKQIILTNAKNGLLASQGDVHVKKTEDGEVRYDASKVENAAAESAYNTISTPRGGTYTITLADGTIVTLDALSSIRFPTVFNGNTRDVTTTGQVYFEVAHNAAKPFRVTTKGQTVEVLGTHFNINAYDDEPLIKTTLLQGSIRISRNGKSALLKPGQQSQINLADSKIDVVQDDDMDEDVAWKNGFFHFNNCDIESVMRQISRWYNVDVEYEGKLPEREFSGKIYKRVSAAQVLAILSLSKVHFRIVDGKKIIVSP
jgi:transmembrane sensor